MPESLDVAKLNELYQKAEQCDKELFSEIRSNVLMVSGKHFASTSRRLLSRLKETRVDEQTKIRLVKNHIHKITRIYVNEILAQAPGVRVLPHNQTELQDQKAAEIANSVWQDAKHRFRLAEKIRDWVEDFIDLGEVACKIFWDESKGRFVGYEQETDEDGQPLFKDAQGNTTTNASTPGQVDPLSGQMLSPDIPNEPLPSKRAIFTGDFVFETILPFNLMRDPNCETMDESPYLITRKMMSVDAAKRLCGGDEEKEKFISESAETTFKVFDGQKGEFVDGTGQVLIREIFYRPSIEYPTGYYALFTETGVIQEQELPFGIFPIVWAGFQKIQTTPRAHSIIRNLRPLQAECNRMASQQAEHQISLGSDKLIIQSGSSVTKGGELPGVRVLKVNGAPPTILPGRSGEQFAASLAATVAEMYDIANVGDIKEQMQGQVDPNTLLFRSMRHKQRFSLYSEIFESFLKDVCRLYLRLAQKYMPEDQMIRVVGKSEHVNISEFKQVDELAYSINLEPVGDDIETALGKSLQIREIIQYLGKDLGPEQIAQIVTAMPFVNGEKMFSELTIDTKNTDSDILALDRGQYVPATKGENHKYIIKRLIHRMKMRDFSLLSPEIQEMYEKKRQEHEQIMADELAEIKRMEAEFIPDDGALVEVGIYTQVPNANGGMKTVHAKLPQRSIEWLMKMLETQGAAKQQLVEMPGGVQANIAAMMAGQQNQQMNGSSGVPEQMQQIGQGNGQGAMNGTGQQFGNTPDPRQFTG